jgi:hypothetical protein
VTDGAERTSGSAGGAPGAAVSAVRQGSAGDKGRPKFPAEQPPTYLGEGGIPESPKSSPNRPMALCSLVAIPQHMAFARIVMGMPALRQMLQPRHSFFRDSQATIEGFRCYRHQDSDTTFLFAEVKAQKGNPYRQYQLSRSHSGRTVGALAGVAAANSLTDFRMADVTMTMPADVSAALSLMPHGTEVAWRCFKRVYRQLPDILGISAGEMSAGVNLHTWKSERPIEPHYHLHSLVLNYTYDQESKTFVKWFGGGIVKRYLDNGKDKQGNQVRKPHWKSGCVPFSDDQLVRFKRVWTKSVRDMCHRHGIGCSYFDDPDALCDVYVGFSKWEDTRDGRSRFIHKVCYQKRSWTEDFCIYSNAHTDCQGPPSWLKDYSNRTRAFGWWMRLSELAGDVVESRAKVSPITGEPMVSADRVYLMDILEGPLAALDNVRGRPVWWVLGEEDRRWLYGACGREYEVAGV